MLDGEMFAAARGTTESLTAHGTCEPGDRTPAVLVGVFNWDGFLDETVDEYDVSAGEATMPSLMAWLVRL